MGRKERFPLTLMRSIINSPSKKYFSKSQKASKDFSAAAAAAAAAATPSALFSFCVVCYLLYFASLNVNSNTLLLSLFIHSDTIHRHFPFPYPIKQHR